MAASANPPDHRDHLAWLKANHVIVLGGDARLEHAIAFVSGFNAATGYSLLREFQDWLVLKAGSGYEIHWTFLAERIVNSSVSASEDGELGQPGAIERFFDLVDEFLVDADDRGGRRALYRRFDEKRDRDGLP